MKAALSRVKKILTGSTIAPHLSHVRVHDGFLHATDGRLFAAVPCDSKENFTVPAAEMDRALAFENLKIEIQDGCVIFKSGRTRIRLGRLDDSAYPLLSKPEEAEWKPFTPVFLNRLHRAREFVSSNATQGWAMTVMVMEKEVIATNNVVLACIENDDTPYLGMIPVWLVDFLLAAEKTPSEIADMGDSIALRWEDGAWIHCLKVVGEFPEQAKKMAVAMRGRQAKWLISDEWRDVYLKTLPFSERDVIVEPHMISATGEKANIETEIESPVKEKSFWSPKFLGPVLEVASHWDIDEYPKASFFHGPGIRGVIVGKIA